MNKKVFSIKDRLKSFVYAWNGIKVVATNEHNFWIHIIAAITVIGLGIYFKIPKYSWIALSFAIGFVFVCETLNSAIEYLCNHVTPEYHPAIKIIKDLAAGAVLLSAITAVVVGGIVFLL